VPRSRFVAHFRAMFAACALCLKHRKLCESHILPEFLYRALYDEKHRMHLLSRDKHGSQIHQKGFKQHLLCEDCESKLAAWERYAKSVLQGGTAISYRVERDLVYVSGLDYHKFRMFQLSMLWRAGVSSLRFFSRVFLGPHTEKMRVLLHEDDPGNHLIYPCLMFGLQMHQGSMQVVVQPTSSKIEQHQAYRFICGGFMWVYVVSSRPIGTPLSAVVLTPPGHLVFQRKDGLQLSDVRDLFLERQRRGLRPPQW
jgi:hypothetical protein